MSKALAALKKQHPFRAPRATATPIYRWLYQNHDAIAELRDGRRVTWKMILTAAQDDGIDVACTEAVANTIRKKWSRIVSERARQKANTTPNPPAEIVSPAPSRLPANWQPEEVKQQYAERDDAERVPPVRAPRTVVTSPDPARHHSGFPPRQRLAVEDNERIPQHGRESISRILNRNHAKKEEKYRLTPD
ncbi:hypothetical protein [Gluconobacter kondonii]|uniref:hypothetical protein n=1 Tax=Gluconobacter kondonii TaxID=941463 RepID=UPI001B8ACCFF|nr:hypothetical protein [Gluconobacter kondonii]MBS1054778.1 hypothetical protein [Gluconobacter kondonii]